MKSIKNIKIKNLRTKNLKTKEFRLSSKKLFLTYPRCDLAPINVLTQLKSILGSYCVTHYLIVVENHILQEQKSTHLHVYLEFNKKFGTKNCNFLDLKKEAVDNLPEEIFHGNYQTALKKQSCIEYILKDIFDIYNTDLIIFSESLKNLITESGVFINYKVAMLTLAKEGKIKEAMDLLEKNDTNSFLKSHDSIEKSLRSIYLKNKGYSRKFDLSKFNPPKDFSETIINSVNEGLKTLMITSASGMGKTQYAKVWLQEHNFNALFVNDINSIKKFQIGIHTCIVFDDCNFKHLNREELIHYFDVENETTIRVTYDSITIPANIPRFILTNESIHTIFNIGDIDSILNKAIRRRLNVYDLKNICLFDLTNKLSIESITENEFIKDFN